MVSVLPVEDSDVIFFDEIIDDDAGAGAGGDSTNVLAIERGIVI